MASRVAFRSSSRVELSPLRHPSLGNGFRSFRSQAEPMKVPDYAFAFDIDGVLVRSHEALPSARSALQTLQTPRIPFILLTNGGGKKEQARTSQLSQLLNIHLDKSMIVQSHTPLRDLAKSLADKSVLVVGGDNDQCRLVAQDYGFRHVIIPGDLLCKHPHLWPFADQSRYESHARPLEKVMVSTKDFSQCEHKEDVIKIDAIMVFNDPRDWALDTQLILDLLMSHQGYLGSISSKNDDRKRPNGGYQSDGQPPLYFTNPDLFWAAKYHLPRLGQGGFMEAFEGVWDAVTGGEKTGVKLKKTMVGKPYETTFDYAEKMLLKHREHLWKGKTGSASLKRVYMVGDNPESDIQGANRYGSPKSPRNIEWHSILVRSGVYTGGAPAHTPEVIVDDVLEAVQWATEHAEKQSQAKES